MDSYPKSAEQDEWRAKNDHGTIMRAAEVMADRVRMRAVIRQQDKHTQAIKTMESMLAAHRVNRPGVFKIRRGRGPTAVVSHTGERHSTPPVTEIQYVTEE